MIFKILSPKNLAKNWCFLLKLLIDFCKNFYHNIGFGEKPQKVVILTSTQVVSFIPRW
jgi:hypothetical protein